MKKLTLLALISFSFCLQTKAQTDLQTMQDIQQTLNNYLDGSTLRDKAMFTKAFSPTGLMQYMQNDTLQIVSLKDFTDRASDTKIKQTNRKNKIESIEVHGNAAVAKLTIEYPTFYYHDIMSLLKTKDGWKIVGKIFYREEKGK
jgi:hypothetical protein